jgi:hypothetical protein
MLLQVHDELLLEGPEAELLRIAPRLCEIMVGALEMQARLHVDLKMGRNWEDMKALPGLTFTTAGSGSTFTPPAALSLSSERGE